MTSGDPVIATYATLTQATQRTQGLIRCIKFNTTHIIQVTQGQKNAQRKH